MPLITLRINRINYFALGACFERKFYVLIYLDENVSVRQQKEVILLKAILKHYQVNDYEMFEVAKKCSVAF